jgi:hypothetical protein
MMTKYPSTKKLLSLKYRAHAQFGGAYNLEEMSFFVCYTYYGALIIINTP